MKTLTKVAVIAALLSTFFIISAYAQTKATGHITAEIVESVSTTSKTVNTFYLKNELLSTTESEQLNPDVEDFNLAEVIISSGAGVGCNLVITPAKLSDARGNDLTIETFLNTNDQKNVRTATGNQTLKLTGRANASGKTASGLFTGSYSVVVAYD